MKREVRIDLILHGDGNHVRNYFPWGNPRAVSTIGPYGVVEYYPYALGGKELPTTRFASSVNGVLTGVSHSTFDLALAFCLAFRREKDPNTRAHIYFLNGLPSRPEELDPNVVLLEDAYDAKG